MLDVEIGTSARERATFPWYPRSRFPRNGEWSERTPGNGQILSVLCSICIPDFHYYHCPLELTLLSWFPGPGLWRGSMRRASCFVSRAAGWRAAPSKSASKSGRLYIARETTKPRQIIGAATQARQATATIACTAKNLINYHTIKITTISRPFSRLLQLLQPNA